MSKKMTRHGQRGERLLLAIWKALYSVIMHVFGVRSMLKIRISITKYRQSLGEDTFPHFPTVSTARALTPTRPLPLALWPLWSLPLVLWPLCVCRSCSASYGVTAHALVSRSWLAIFWHQRGLLGTSDIMLSILQREKRGLSIYKLQISFPQAGRRAL